MEQLPENNTEQGNRSASVSQPSLGNMLRAARERLGLSVADVAAQIKFAPRQIEALEADDFGNLPEAAFLRGFVRSYAKILQLDAQILLAAMPHAKSVSAELVPASVEVPFPTTFSPQRQTIILLGAAILLALVVAAFTLWSPVQQATSTKVEIPVTLPDAVQTQPEPPELPVQVEQKPEAAEPTAHAEAKTRVAANEKKPVKIVKTPAVSAVPQTATIEAKPRDDSPVRIGSLRLVFDEESWTEIKDRDGTMISSQINPRGSELNIKGSLPLSLVIGHAATTHLYMDGEPVDLTPYIHSSSEVARITLE